MTTNSDPDDKKGTVALRIQPNIIDKLYEESKQKYEDLGDVVNRILNNYFSWQKDSFLEYLIT